MNFTRIAAPLALLGILGVACGSDPSPATLDTAPVTVIDDTTTTTAAQPTTTTTLAPTTATTVCVPADTSALQNYLDTLRGSIRQVESAIGQIQLVIDNGGRSLEAARRYRDGVQAEYDEAKAASELLGGDTQLESLVSAERRLANANGVVASWEATIRTAQADLRLAQQQKADYERKASTTVAQIQQASSAC